MRVQADVLCAGTACAEVLRLTEPLSFWGGVDPKTARVTLAGHPQMGEAVTGRVLLLPGLIGSSSSSAVLLELLYAGTAPAALIMTARDAILPIGVVVAAQMGWSTIPVLVAEELVLNTGDRVTIAHDGWIGSS